MMIETVKFLFYWFGYFENLIVIIPSLISFLVPSIWSYKLQSENVCESVHFYLTLHSFSGLKQMTWLLKQTS